MNLTRHGGFPPVIGLSFLPRLTPDIHQAVQAMLLRPPWLCRPTDDMCAHPCMDYSPLFLTSFVSPCTWHGTSEQTGLAFNIKIMVLSTEREVLCVKCVCLSGGIFHNRTKPMKI